MKLAIYKAITSSYTTVDNAEGWIESDSGYVRVSEILDIDFPELKKEDVIVKSVEKIDSQIEEITQEMLKNINTLKGKKAELLALTIQEDK